MSLKEARKVGKTFPDTMGLGFLSHTGFYIRITPYTELPEGILDWVTAKERMTRVEKGNISLGVSGAKRKKLETVGQLRKADPRALLPVSQALRDLLVRPAKK